MRNIFREHTPAFWTQAHKRSFYMGLLLIVLALVIQISAGRYSASMAATAGYESDILLNNLPVVHLGFIIVGGEILFWVFSLFMIAIRPRRLLFGIKAIALFTIIRAFFINLTREGIYPGGAMPHVGNLGFGFYHLLTFKGNFFFSGHTGFAFLMALLFWDSTLWRRFFVWATVFFGAAVLLAHVHYSIDVFSAPFIVYGIFAIAAKLFPRDYALMLDARKAGPLL